MIKEIVKDEKFLSQKSEKFVFGEDDHLIQDLLDTAEHYGEKCAGLACVQIGTPKRVLVAQVIDKFVPFINPIIIQKSQQTYMAQEGCLSLEGLRMTKRHRKIKVGYLTKEGKSQCKEFSGFTAQVLQHEIDHLNGILI